MTTLAANKVRPFELGDLAQYPMVASDTLYEGAAVGLVPASGHARPLAAGDRFVGFATGPYTSGATAGVDLVEVRRSGSVQLPVAGAVITDVGAPVYAADDDTFQFSPVAGVFIGLIRRWVAAGIVVVEFGPHLADPYGRWSVRETISDNKTLAAVDCGKLFWVAADAKVVTLPAIADGLAGPCIVNGGAFGTVAVTITPNAADMILGPDITGANEKSLINTKTTAQRGDRVQLTGGDADGYLVTELVGTWARQA